MNKKILNSISFLVGLFVIGYGVVAGFLIMEWQVQKDNNSKTGISVPLEKKCINRCGDGACQEIVCMGNGCPCSESLQTCSKDCSKSKPNPINMVPYKEDGTCPFGYVDYGVPLQCITPEYMERCKTSPCPICLAGSTLIETPRGLILVKDIKVGMPVWTTNIAGKRVLGIVKKTSKTPVLSTHKMVHLILKDGRELFASFGHPTYDGRVIGYLKINDLYDKSFIASVEQVPYNEGATYDILSSGETGFYWANGILVGSTLLIK